MKKTIWLGDYEIVLDPGKRLGEGGEAHVYDIGPDNRKPAVHWGVKLFKKAEERADADTPEKVAAIIAYYADMERKLGRFARLRWPSRIVIAKQMAYDLPPSAPDRKLVGYAMHKKVGMLLNRFISPKRLQSRDELFQRYQDVPKIMLSMLDTVGRTHALNVAFVDLNAKNVMVNHRMEADFLDFDSYRYADFHCPMSSPEYTDPSLPGPETPRTLEMHKGQDRYAYHCLFFQCLLGIHPYRTGLCMVNGIQLTQAQRMAGRYSALHPLVTCPGDLPTDILPPELRTQFKGVFEGDRREPFPADLLEPTRWTKWAEAMADGIVRLRLK
jgi:DNA-binding helix-hairpin-helix protein with protein kinase domain